MRFFKAMLLLVGMLCVPACGATVRTGLDCVDAHRALFEGKRVGIIANHTARDAQGRHIADVFLAMDNVTVTALFSPEHGLYGAERAGDTIDSSTDSIHGLPVRSLYGQTRKPTAEMLRDVDILVFDIQDVGARFYTYMSTMSLAMEAAGECGKEFVVLDRPNPITGLHIEGPVLEPEFSSFVGLHPIPVRHGLTAGELARLFNGEGWLAGGVRAELTVVPMQNWHRDQWFDQTGLTFVKPSPNIPDIETATVYPGLCLFEGTNLSEGRGTPKPFLQFGAPWLSSEALARRLNALDLPGLSFSPTFFTPTASKYAGTLCHGIEITVFDRERLNAFWSGVSIVNELYRMNPERFEWRTAHFDRLCGTAAIRKEIIAREFLDKLDARFRGIAWMRETAVMRELRDKLWTPYDAECRAFEKARQPYLLYR